MSSTLHRYNSFRRANAFTWETNMRKLLELFKAHHQICGYNGEVDKLTVAVVRVDKWINSQPVMQCVVTSHNFETWSTWWAVCSQRELERGWEQQAGRQRCTRESTPRACRRERQTSCSHSLQDSPEKFVNVKNDIYDCLNFAISTQTFERSSFVTDDSSSCANSRPLSAWSHLKGIAHWVPNKWAKNERNIPKTSLMYSVSICNTKSLKKCFLNYKILCSRSYWKSVSTVLWDYRSSLILFSNPTVVRYKSVVRFCSTIL